MLKLIPTSVGTLPRRSFGVKRGRWFLGHYFSIYCQIVNPKSDILDADSSPIPNQENYEANLMFSNYPIITNVVSRLRLEELACWEMVPEGDYVLQRQQLRGGWETVAEDIKAQ